MKRTSQRHGRGGVAGLEFALLSPVLLTLFLGTIDLSGALVTARRMAAAAGAVAQTGTVGAAQNNALNVLTDMQAWQATTAAFALFPGWTRKAAAHSFAITLSAVNFTAAPVGCTQNCTYTARVAWSVANPLGASQLRACGTLTKVPNTAATSYATLPTGDFGPTSLLVADISATLRPVSSAF